MMTFRHNTMRPRPFAPHAIEVYRSSVRRRFRVMAWAIATLVVVDVALVVGFVRSML